ncbi:hypothetical protein Tco_1114210 [Tanacetum coccineum]|uniref:Uncharacterized protein n=1 Tax=Tanacetum coccineum TaxID=301880 RepID=A0ABQ5IWP9_9ASTR
MLSMRKFEANHQNGYVNVAWLLAKWMKRKEVGTQRENGLSASTYCRALDVFTLKELFGPNGRLIAEDPTPGTPRVATPKGPRPTITELHDKINHIETHQGMLERMARRQSYQLDRYVGVLEYMVGQYNVLIQGAYAPPGYDEEQQDDE